MSTATYGDLLRFALEETGDAEEALAAVELALSYGGVELAHDVHSSRAQKVLDRALKAARALSAAARKELAAAFKKPSAEAGPLLATWLTKYRQQLTDLLSSTQLAALLEGAREVAGHLPVIPAHAGAVPPPPTLPPEKAAALLDRLRGLGDLEQAAELYRLPPAEQHYARAALGSAGGVPNLPLGPAPFVPPGPGRVHLTTIEEAARLLSDKNVVRQNDLSRMAEAARNKAFTVAGADAAETLTRVRDLLAENVKEGASLADFQKAVEEEGLGGTFLSDPHLETVFRTNVQAAFSDGQMSVLRQPFVRSGFPYARYDAIHDDRVRENHLALETLGIDGTNCYRVDDPVFETFRPPWDYQDRCGWVPTSIAQAAEMGVKEAQEWLRTGEEPTPPARVPWPDFRPPAAFHRVPGAAPLSLAYSLLPLNVELAQDPNDPSLWHGPTPPGPGWVDAGTGPRGGKMWKYQGGGAAPQQQPSQPQAPGQDLTSQFQALPPEAQAFVKSLLNMAPEQLAAFKQSLGGGGQLQAPQAPPVQPPSPEEPIPPQAVPPLLQQQGEAESILPKYEKQARKALRLLNRDVGDEGANDALLNEIMLDAGVPREDRGDLVLEMIAAGMLEEFIEEDEDRVRVKKSVRMALEADAGDNEPGRRRRDGLLGAGSSRVGFAAPGLVSSRSRTGRFRSRDKGRRYKWKG